MPPLKELGIGARVRRNYDGATGGRKSFKIGLAVLIQYRRVTDRHPASQPATMPYQVPRLLCHAGKNKG